MVSNLPIISNNVVRKRRPEVRKSRAEVEQKLEGLDRKVEEARG